MRNANYFGRGTLSRFMIVILVIAIIITSVNVTIYAGSGTKLADKIAKDREEDETTQHDRFEFSASVYYPEYIAENEEDGYGNYKGEGVYADIKSAKIPEDFKPEDFLFNSYISQELNESFEGDFFVWDESKDLRWVEFNVDVKEKAFYDIEIEYYTPKGSIQTPQRTLNIDGQLPFKEAVTVDFMRSWYDEDKTPKFNTIGNQIRPKQLESFEFRTMRIQDHDGKYSMPLKFALDEGSHVIGFYQQYESIVIKSIKLVSPIEVPTYNEKLAEWKAAGYKEASITEPIKVQGESAIYKSVPSLRMEGSSDPACEPAYEDGSTRLNVIGNTWSDTNQTITWKIEDVQEAGLYKIALRTYAKYTDGLPVYRQIKINGEVPFKEFECYKVPFDDWNCFALEKEDGEPLLVYLNKGDNTIEMTVKFGELTDIMNALERDSARLSDLVKDITRVTGTKPDPNFEYKLEQKIPKLKENLQELIDSFSQQIDRISGLSKKRPAAVNNFIGMREQLIRMINNTDLISKNYEELTKTLANLGLWIKEFGKLPMQIDYIEFIKPDAEVKVVKSTFFQRIGAAVTSFIVSFSKDYDSIGGLTDEQNEDTKYLDVWIARAKEWAEILKQQSDEDFFTKENISLNMNVLPSGQLNASATNVLLLAIASGTGPDVALGVAANLPVEYGMRGAIHPISSFDDFDDIYNRFLEGIMIPFYFKDEYYALPETMDFQCLYYRKDILDEYKIEIPDTWTEVYTKVLPVLSRNGMQFNYLAGYNPFLFQYGGEYFKNDGTESAWDSGEAIAGFKQWTDLYTIYDVPVLAEFYNRIRAGQMPMGVGGLDIYIKLVSTAPEITGKWGVAPIPGVAQTNEDGETVINRSSGGTTTACIILESSDNHDEAWKFLKWYTDADTQVTYANDIKSIIGPEAVWASANVEAFDRLPWDAELKDVINEYKQWYKDPPNVVGGYIVARYLENARVAVVTDKKAYRPSLEKSVREINRELDIKNEEFERRAEYESKNNKDNN